MKDCDGNLIEMMDLGYMYYVLEWLGPLGGFLFRRGMYKQVLPSQEYNNEPKIRDAILIRPDPSVF